MRALLLFLAACAVDAPQLGHVYQCSGELVCDGERYELKAQEGCAEDSAEARDAYEASFDLSAVRCKYVLETTCVDTRERCTR